MSGVREFSRSQLMWTNNYCVFKVVKHELFKIYNGYYVSCMILYLLIWKSTCIKRYVDALILSDMLA